MRQTRLPPRQQEVIPHQHVECVCKIGAGHKCLADYRMSAQIKLLAHLQPQCAVPGDVEGVDYHAICLASIHPRAKLPKAPNG